MLSHAQHAKAWRVCERVYTDLAAREGPAAVPRYLGELVQCYLKVIVLITNNYINITNIFSYVHQ